MPETIRHGTVRVAVVSLLLGATIYCLFHFVASDATLLTSELAALCPQEPPYDPSVALQGYTIERPSVRQTVERLSVARV